MDNYLARSRLVLAVLLIASAALFAIGVAIERAGEDQHREGVTERATHEEDEAGHSEERDRSGEGIFGINPESPVAVIGVVAISALLALAVWLRPATTPILLATAAFGIITGLFDAREVLIQAGRADRLVMLLAALIAAIHLGAAVLAVSMVRRARSAVIESAR